MNLKDLAYSFELWYGALKQIEGNFGTGVASFFKFLRWLFLLNAAIALLSICFIVIPKVILISDSQTQTESGAFSIFDLVTGQVSFLIFFLFLGVLQFIFRGISPTRHCITGFTLTKLLVVLVV